MHMTVAALADTLTPRQQQRFENNLRKLIEVHEARGDILEANFGHALCGDEYVERPKPQLYLVKS
jgi:hypothetical protein